MYSTIHVTGMNWWKHWRAVGIWTCVKCEWNRFRAWLIWRIAGRRSVWLGYICHTKDFTMKPMDRKRGQFIAWNTFTAD